MRNGLSSSNMDNIILLILARFLVLNTRLLVNLVLGLLRQYGSLVILSKLGQVHLFQLNTDIIRGHQ